MAGRVPVQVESHSGPIRAGDYLTTSDIPGVAKRADAAGLTIGVALEDFNDGRGEILMLVQRGWYGGDYSSRSREELVSTSIGDRDRQQDAEIARGSVVRSSTSASRTPSSCSDWKP
ncbi:MAG: hypothetical protein R3B90_17345 [Planctomycetaceae bacterium]